MLKTPLKDVEVLDPLPRAEKELAEKSHLLEIALNAVDQGFIVWDEGNCVIIANNRMSELWDYPTDLLKPGTPAIELFRYQARIGAYGEGDPEEVAQARYEYILATRNEGEDEITTAAGRILRCRRYMVEGLGWAATYTNITDLKQTENALRTSEGRYLQAAQLLKLGYWVWDHHNDRCISCSDELAKMHGVSVDEYLASTDTLAKELQWIHPEDLLRVHSRNSGNESYDIEFRIILRNGQVRYVREIGEPEFDANGKVIRSSGTMQDITEQRIAEDELKKQGKLIALLRKTAGDANRAVNFKDAIQTCLDTICEYTGWPVGHAFIRSKDDPNTLYSTRLWHLDDADRFAVFRKATDGGEMKHGKGLVSRVFDTRNPLWIEDVVVDGNFARLQDIEGDPIVRSGFGIPVLYQDTTAAVLEFYTDEVVQQDEDLLANLVHVGNQLGRVFERNAAEVVLKNQVVELTDREERLETQALDLVAMAEDLKTASDELGELNEQKDRFFAIVAHDLKSPFNALLGFTQILSTQSKTMTTEKVVEYSSLVHRSAEAAFKLVEDLLEWSRLQLGRIEYNPKSIDVNEIFATTMARFQTVAAAKQIEINAGCTDQLRVEADAPMIDTILRNLVSNAIKFSESGGIISISASATAEWVEITVADDGIGIPHTKLENLFVLGEKSSTNGTDGESGTGLGLQLCKELVEAHGGEISVESAEGKGSTFRFTLPSA